MVFFTCNHCGDSVKKNKVEQHAVRCSQPISVSCMDCNKDFHGKTYNEHTQCITELEKYSPKGFVAKPTSTKGLVKQQAWMSLVNSLIDSAKNLPAEDKKLLTIISKHENIPRKKNKFENFLKNGIYRGNKDSVDRVWDLLQQKFNEMKNSNEANVSTNGATSESKRKLEEVENTPPKKVKGAEGIEGEKRTKKQKKALKKAKSSTEDVGNTSVADVSLEEMGSLENVSKTKKGKKRKSGGAADESKNLEASTEARNGDASPSPKKKSKKDNFGFTVDTIGDSPLSKILNKKQNNVKASVNNSPSPGKEDEKFDWSEAIVKVLASANNKELPVKVLRKKVLAQYSNVTSRPITDTIKSKFNKRLNQVPNVKAVKGRAVLSSTV